MRILHVHLSREFAGSERYCAELAAAQAAAGDEVRVVVRASSVVPRWRQEIGKAGLLVIPRWVPSVLEGWVLRRFMVGFEPEVVHSHLGRAHVKAGKACKSMKIPHVGTVHLRWKAKEHAGCDGIIAVAAWQVADIPVDFGGAVRVVWNWTTPRVGGRKKVQDAEKAFIFGSVGRLHKQKGMDVLVAAFKRCFGGGNGVAAGLLVVGEGAQRKSLEDARDADARIVLAGYAERVEEYYDQFDVYVSASRHEPFGLTILEAMEAGLPLVLTKSEGPTEFLAGKGEAEGVRWVEKDDVEGLAAALKAAYAEGRRRVEWDMTPFRVERAVREVREVYEQLRMDRVTGFKG